MECYCGTLKCRFHGMKSEPRFKFRHMADVSIRALRHVSSLCAGQALARGILALQDLELPGHRVSPKVEV